MTNILIEICGVVQNFVWIPPGSMPGPFSKVIIDKGFWLADTVCTQEFWYAIMGFNPSTFTNNSDNPVETISMSDVRYFTNTLNKLIIGKKVFTLPTRLEWEYACRAGTNTEFNCGSELLPTQANFGSNINKTTPVRTYPPNIWGLYDMHGNVWEPCLSMNNDIIVYKGGSYSSLTDHCKSANTENPFTSSKSSNIGFRLKMEIK